MSENEKSFYSEKNWIVYKEKLLSLQKVIRKKNTVIMMQKRNVTEQFMLKIR